MADLIDYTNPNNFPREWQINRRTIDVIGDIKPRTIKHGLCANIPIICKGIECPYLATCKLVATGHDPEEFRDSRCPQEIMEVMSLFAAYSEALHIDENETVDLSLVKELVDCEIMIQRASRKQAEEGDFTEMIVIGVDSQGNPIRTKQITKSSEFKDTQAKRKEHILNLLNATRKDKASNKMTIDITGASYASDLVARAQQLREEGRWIDIDPIEDNEGEEDGAD